MKEQEQKNRKQQKQSLISQLWLHYYNSYLYEKQIITETERNKMKNMINQYSGPSEKKKKQTYKER